MSALNLLSTYNSDSDSENEIPGPRVSVKRCIKEDDNKTTKLMKTERIPLPSILKSVKNNAVTDKSSLHGGKIRSFPHERGNWSSFVYITYEHNTVMLDLIKDIIEKSKSLFMLQPSEDLHISLTKTVVLSHHWIEPFTKLIAQHLVHTPSFVIFFDKLKVYCNEERTRTFIGLQIKSGYYSLLNLVEILDRTLKEFNLPEFYKDPSFHMSLVWCVGDYESILNNIIDDLNAIVEEYMTNYTQNYWNIYVKSLVFKTGNKYFNFKLGG